MAIFIITTIVILVLFIIKARKLKAIQKKYAPITNIEVECDKKRAEEESAQKVIQDEINAKKAELSATINKLSEKKDSFKTIEQQIEKAKETLSIFESSLDIIEYGIYTPVYNFATSDEYKTRLSEIIDKQKEMVQNNKAATCSTNWTVDGSASKGQKVVKIYQKLILRAFNGECDALISKVKWNNFEQVKERIYKLRETLNKLGESFSVTISNSYCQLKIQELTLEHEYNLKKQKEKEEQRAAQEALQEEERARKEYERAEQDALKEEQMYQKALDKARKEAQAATGDEQQKLLEKIKQLESDLAEAEAKKQRALSMAQQTKRGHVYVISNIGSFGENVYKIGMTRRLEPEDRVRELGDASVPFSFDIHAMIFSEDAPKLESALHNQFDTHKVNMVNPRKEFFNVTLSEIKDVVKKNDIDAEFIDIPEAEEYRETKAIMSKLQLQRAGATH